MTNQAKNWDEIATNFVNIWTESSTQMWKSWLDVMGTTPTQKADIKLDLEEVTQHYIDNQELLFRYLKLSINTWQDIFPKIESSDDWQVIFSKSIEKMREQLQDFSTTTLKSSEDIGELWQLYFQQIQKFYQLWFDPLSMTSGTMAKAFMGNPSALIKVNNFYWNTFYGETFGNLLQAPLLGLPREFNRKILDGFEAWRNLYRASINYQIILANIQIRSFEALMKELVTLAEKGEPVNSWRQFQDIWSQVSDDVFAKEFCQSENLQVRGNFLNALNTYRIQQQEFVELLMQSLNLPLRSEVDEIHKNIYELRKEVKSLKKALAAKDIEIQNLKANL